MMAITITMMSSTAENAPVRAAGSQVGVESIMTCAVVGESTNEKKWLMCYLACIACLQHLHCYATLNRDS